MSIYWICSVVRAKRLLILQYYPITVLVLSPRHWNNSEPSSRAFFPWKAPSSKHKWSLDCPFLSLRFFFPFFPLLIICIAALCILSTSLTPMNIDARDCASTLSLLFRDPAGAMCNILAVHTAYCTLRLHDELWVKPPGTNNPNTGLCSSGNLAAIYCSLCECWSAYAFMINDTQNIILLLHCLLFHEIFSF